MSLKADINPQENDLSEGLIGVESYKPEEPTAKQFLPWHRPRKQFVRDKQWTEQIALLIDDDRPADQPLSYLGLPGDDLLDLRHFHDKICVPRNIKLKFLGFNTGAGAGKNHKADLEISLDEINKLPLIDTSSDLIGDDFTKIAVENSIAWQRSCKMGPFDIINIDLCDGFAKHPLTNFKETHFNSLSRLMALQARRPNPWLLLITTRTGIGCVDDEVFDVLKEIYEDNLNTCERFLQASTEKFSVQDNATLTQYCEDHIGASNIFLTSLCKWILKIGHRQNPPSSLEVKSVLGYKVAAEAPSSDLVSFAIKITPTFNQQPDPTGLANQATPSLDECTMAVRALKRISNQRDIDGILQKDDELMNQMIQDTASLLEQARYNVAQYPNWAKGIN